SSDVCSSDLPLIHTLNFLVMKNVAVIGLGKVGSLVGTLLSDVFTVTGLDRQQPAAEVPFDVVTGSVTDAAQLRSFLGGKDAVVSCLPYNLNLPVAEAAHALG